jgi:hypothetical protein
MKKEVLKLLHARIIYHVPHSEWVSPIQVVPRKGGMTIIENNKNELIPQRTITRWRICIDYQKLNVVTKKGHFPLPFINEMLERLASILSSVSSMGIRDIIRFPSTPMIRARQLSHARTKHLLIDECHLGCVMHPPRSNDA